MSKYIPRKSLPENIAVPKGATEALKVDRNEIERMLMALRKNSEVLVSQADKTSSIYIRTIRDHALKFYNTSSYEDFYKLILKHFSDVGILLPNTISSFLIGRGLYKGEFDNKSYAPTCVGSIPSLEDSSSIAILESDKNITIIYRDYGSGRSIINPIFKAKASRGDIVVLMGDLDSSATVLANSELDLLKSINLSKYELYIYFNGHYYKEAKKPLALHRPKHNGSNINSLPYAGISIVIIAVVVLLVIFFAMRSKHA